MLSIRRIIACLELSRFHASAGNSIPPELSPAFANSIRLAGIHSIPFAVAGILPPASSTSPTNLHTPASTDPPMPTRRPKSPETSYFRTAIDREAAAVGVAVPEYEEFISEEWCRILATETCHSDVMLAFDLHQNHRDPSPPEETTCLNALNDFGGVLWFHNCSQFPVIAPENQITDVIAPVTSDATAMEIIFVAVNTARSLQARLWLVPGRFRNNVTGECTPETLTIYSHLANCDYRTLPFGVRVTEHSNNLEDTIKRQLEDCRVPMLLQQRNPADNSCVPAFTHPLFSAPQCSLLLLPAESFSFPKKQG